jgi:hypothetical protein
MNRVKRFGGGAILLAVAAVLATGTHARASTPVTKPCVPVICEKQTPEPPKHSSDPGDAAAPTATASALAVTVALTTPVPTPALPDSGFAQSATVQQGDDPVAAALKKTNQPPAVASLASAPGFGSLGIPLLIAFAGTGLIAVGIRRAI